MRWEVVLGLSVGAVAIVVTAGIIVYDFKVERPSEIAACESIGLTAIRRGKAGPFCVDVRGGVYVLPK